MTKKPFSQIALACFLAAVVSADSFARNGRRFLSDFIPGPIQLGIVGMYFVAIIIYIFVGIRKAVNKHEEANVLAFWQGALRYFLALDLCVFGVMKFFHLQFITPLALLDNPFKTIPSGDIMWAFFGRSYVFTVIIGSLEILGSLMLVFRKTRLLGVIVLIPVMLNVFLLDFFYNTGAPIYVAIEIIALVYLLLIEKDRLVKFFLVDKSDLPQFNFKSAAWKNVARLSVVAIPLLLMAINKFPQYYPDINGKYMVKNLVINNIQQPAPCADSVLTKVYIDKNDFVLEYNGYSRRFIGSYKYNEATKQITVTWRYPQKQHDTLYAEILPGNGADKKILNGHMGKETFKIDMQRVDKGN